MIRLVFSGAALLALIWYGLLRGVPTGQVRHTDYGTVSSVTNCNSSKHTLRCRVGVDEDSHFYNFDVTDFPGDYLEVSDKIGLEIRWSTRSQTYRTVRNDWSREISRCYWWMKCFQPYVTSGKSAIETEE